MKIIYITLNSIIFLKISVYMNYIITVNKHNKDYQILVKRTSCLGVLPLNLGTSRKERMGK